MAIKIPIVTEFNGKGVSKALKSFSQLDSAGKKMAFALTAGAAGATAAIAAVGTAAFQAGQQILDFTNMAAADQKSQLQLAQSIKASTKATDKQISATEDWIDQVQRATGVADDELRPAYARIVRSTHSLKKANDLMRVSLDVSAATGKSLSTVVNALSRASDGSTTALGKLGLGFDKAYLKATPFDEIVKKLNDKFSGSALKNAETYAGTMDRFKIAVDELKEGLGYVFLPALQKMADIGSAVASAFGKNGIAGAVAELKFQLKNLFYDENGQLNQAGKTLNDLIDKFNKLKSIAGASFLSALGPGGAALNLAAGKIGLPSFGGFQATSKLGATTNAAQFREIRNYSANNNTIYIQSGIGDPVAIGREVFNVLQKLERRNGGRVTVP